jgi:hypothetical protein
MKKHRAFWIGCAFASAGGASVIVASCTSRSDASQKPNASTTGSGDGLPAECATEAASMPGNPPQHPAACHGNPDFESDAASLMKRGDIAQLPSALRDQLVRLACRPHSALPTQFFAEADTASQLFQYYLLDTKGFQPNVFTSLFPGINDTAMFTATGANCGLPTVAAVRLVVEPKPGLPSNPQDPRAFIDIMTDISGLFVINNESGWYEGWMIHDLQVAAVQPCDGNGHAKFGTITPGDAAKLAAMGNGNNAPGRVFTVDGNAPHFPSATDHFPDRVTNVVPLQLSMGAYNALQQSDAHQYWEFNYTTNWIHPAYELPFTGGFADTYQRGVLGLLASIVPGDRIGLNQDPQRAITFGDNPDLPRDPDKFDADVDSQREFRQRFVPSAIAREAFLNTFQRLDSFMPETTDLTTRLNAGYKAAIAIADTNGDGIISAPEGDPDTCNARCFPATPSDQCAVSDSSCLYLPAGSYGRFAVTREINDGYLAPRFAPSQRAWVLSGSKVDVSPIISASQGRDSDDR